MYLNYIQDKNKFKNIKDIYTVENYKKIDKFKKLNVLGKINIFLKGYKKYKKNNLFLKSLSTFKKIKKINFYKKKLFKFIKNFVYFDKNKKSKKKNNKSNLYKELSIVFKKSKIVKDNKKNYYNIYFFLNGVTFKKWVCFIKEYNSYAHYLIFRTRKKFKTQIWHNVIFYNCKKTKNLICYRFNNKKEKYKYLEKYFFKRLDFISKKYNFLLFFYNLYYKKKKKWISLFLKNNKNLNFQINFNKKIIINFLILRKHNKFFKKNFNFYFLKSLELKKKYIKIKKNKKRSQRYFKILKSIKDFQLKFKNYNRYKHLDVLKFDHSLKKKYNFIKFKNIKKKKNKQIKKFINKNKFNMRRILKKKTKFKKNILIFWFFFKNTKLKKYKLQHFKKKYFIFFRFYSYLINSKKKHKKKKNYIKCNNFRKNFWSLESKLNIFLVRVGFLKNIIQSNFLISKGAIFINNKTVINSSKHIKINDILQISYFMMFFLKFLYKKKKNLNFFLIQKLLKKKKSPFYLEINEKIKTCLLLYKPLPKKNDLRSIKKFNFFFYKFLFLFLKKKTF